MRFDKSFIALFLVIFSIFFLSGCIANKVSFHKAEIVGGDSFKNIELSNSLSGSYLAARFAQQQKDWQQASYFMQQVLSKDINNDNIRQRSFLLSLGSGEFETAIDLAKQIALKEQENEIVYLTLIAKNINENNFDEAWKYTSHLNGNQFNEYMQTVIRAWLVTLSDKKADELASLKEKMLNSEADSLYLLHLALISEYTGNDKDAEKYYSSIVSVDNITIQTALAITYYYYKKGNIDKANEMYNNIKKQARVYRSIELSNLMELVSKNYNNPKYAISLVFFEIATMLYEKQAYDSALIYVRLSEMISPNTAFIQVMIADIYAAQGNYDKAATTYGKVANSVAISDFIKLKEAEMLDAANRGEDAILLLLDVVKTNNNYIDIFVYLGDMYRKYGYYDKAIDIYSQALDKVKDKNSDYWYITYARGMTHERKNNWTAAEKDLLTALEVQPDNPLILNYIGYSWVDMGINLEKAMEMIKRAVMLKPDDGYIIDSYGWALYKMGKYDEAVKWLEYSAEILPYDVTINDHLGDAYWRVGRKIEAKFQWNRAYLISDDKQEKQLIEQKIKFGITTKEEISSEREAMLHN